MDRTGTCTVNQLKAALNRLKDDDHLVTNKLGNLIIVRDGKFYGYIELGWLEFKAEVSYNSIFK